jgi:hypothetical protein
MQAKTPGKFMISRLSSQLHLLAQLCFLKLRCSEDSSQQEHKLLGSASGRLLSGLQISCGLQFR